MGAPGPFPPGNSSQPPGPTDPDSNSVHVGSGRVREGDPPGLGCLSSLPSSPYLPTHCSGLPWTEPGDTNMDERLSGRQALSSGLWASCILCSPVGGLRHPLPGDKRPLLLPGSRGGECSKSSLRTTESSLGSARQPHPPCSALGALRAPSQTVPWDAHSPQGWGVGAAGGSREMQAEQQAALKGTGPPTGAQLPEKGLFLPELWGAGVLEWGTKDSGGQFTCLRPPSWEPRVCSTCRDPHRPPVVWVSLPSPRPRTCRHTVGSGGQNQRGEGGQLSSPPPTPATPRSGGRKSGKSCRDLAKCPEVEGRGPSGEPSSGPHRPSQKELLPVPIS